MQVQVELLGREKVKGNLSHVTLPGREFCLHMNFYECDVQEIFFCWCSEDPRGADPSVVHAGSKARVQPLVVFAQLTKATLAVKFIHDKHILHRAMCAIA